VLARRGRSAALFIYVAGSALFALLAALVTRGRPAAKGSGIPEVKAIVAGFAIPKSFQAGTLAAKVLALSLCVGAGLAVGKEGPMIHIGACWGVLLAAPISRLAHLGVHIEETELICVGAAAGVSAAFGAPLAGVLFAIEELGTTMPTGLRYTTMLCSFGSAVVAAMALKWVDLTRTQRLTLFEVDYKQAWAPWEAIPFCMLGVCGGVLGAGFVLANEAIHKRRLSAESNGSASWFLGTNVSHILHRRLGWAIDGRVLEVVLLGILTAVSNYPNTLTRMLQNDAIKALFSQCPDTAATRHRMPLQDPVGLCGDPQDAVALWELLRLLLGAASLRFLQTTVTFGALTPAGLFVPSLYMGGCFGRAVGVLMKSAGFPGTQGIEPGIYAMVGAGAMLAGVSRLTLSLAVVLFELTGGLTYVVPFMLAVLTAKWTGDVLTNDRSVYDVHGELKGFTKVEQPNEVRLLNATLRDIRSSNTASSGLGIETLGTRSLAANSAAPPAPLWVSAGRVLSSDLAAHCRAAGSAAGSAAGFPVLSIGSGGSQTREADLELLGWAHADRVLAQLALAGVAADKASVWCQFTPVLAQRPARAGEPRVEDFSQTIEPRAVVRVRGDCPLQTAFCIFQNCPDVRALVSVDGAPFSVQTTTRELFASSLLHSSLCALSSEGTPLCAAEKASNACLAANSKRLDVPASASGFEKGSVDGAGGGKSEQH
jgi:H+/Cl- antiporter ClcA